MAADRRVKQPPAQNDGVEEARGTRLLTLGDAVALKNRLTKEWKELSSEAIFDALSFLRGDDGADFTEIDLKTQSELWLLKALACEKSPRRDHKEIEDAYNHCLGGQFRIVLVLNNLGVLQAHDQKCEEALELFEKAIGLALGKAKLKAPFYNCALVFDHLRRQGTIHSYLRPLARLESLTRPPKEEQSTPDGNNPNGSAEQDYWPDSKIHAACKQIARYGYGFDGSAEEDFYYSKAKFLVPVHDLMASFGDLHDGLDRAAADQLQDEAEKAQKEKEFDRSITMFEMVSDFDPSRRTVLATEIKKTAEQWRQLENDTIVKLTRDYKYAEAIDRLRLVRLNPRLADKKDEDLMNKILRRKHEAADHEAELLAAAGQAEQAIVKYKQLLGEEINPELRKRVSMKLANLLK